MASEVSIVRQFFKLIQIHKNSRSPLIFSIGKHIYSRLEKTHLVITDGFGFDPYILYFKEPNNLTDYYFCIENIEQEDFKNESDSFLILKYGREILNNNIILNLNRTDTWGSSNLNSFNEFLSL